MADAQGEFVEVGNAGERGEAADTVWLVVDGDSIGLGRLSLGAGEMWLGCRDSAAMAAVGVACHKGLAALSLANSRALKISVAWGGMRSDFEVPAAKTGLSQENTWDEEKGLRAFARSGLAFLAGDSATPGFRNSRSVRRARRDLAIGEAAVRGGILHVTVADLGSERAGGGVAVRADRDWDGKAETWVDSLAVAPGGGGMEFALGPDHEGILEITLAGDENPSDNKAWIYRGAGKALEISEVCPAPEEGPEWAEIRNATAMAGGGAVRTLDLSRVEWNGRPLGPEAGRLLPGEHLILTEDAEALRTLLGPLKVRILDVEGWGSLRNTGDTCRLSLRSAGLDSLAYGAKEAASGRCATPGYPSPLPPARLALSLSRRILLPGERAELTVDAPEGRSYALRIFDLEGNCRRTLGRGGAGRHGHAWSGEGERGNRLPPGPYIIALASGGSLVKRTVILADAP